jgi:hypothetical protein
MDDESNFMDEVLLRDEYSFLYSDWGKLSLELDTSKDLAASKRQGGKVFPIAVEFTSDIPNKPYQGPVKELLLEADFTLPLDALFQSLYTCFVTIPNVPCRFIYTSPPDLMGGGGTLTLGLGGGGGGSSANLTSSTLITTLDLQQSLLEHNILPFSKLSFVKSPMNALMATAQLSGVVTSPSLKQILEEEGNIWTEPEDSDQNIRLEAAPLSPSASSALLKVGSGSSSSSVVVVAGTLNKLVQRLTNEKVHGNYISLQLTFYL